MERKSLNDIFIDWKTHVLQPEGYPKYKERLAFLIVLFEEVKKNGYSRQEANSHLLKSRIEDRLFYKETKHQKKNEIKKSILDQIEIAISRSYGSFGTDVSEIKEEKKLLNIDLDSIIKKVQDEELESTPSPVPRKELRDFEISEERTEEILNKFNWRVGCDEDLD